MTRKAWDSVTLTTIANCFRKGGFVLSSENEEIDAEAEMEAEDMHSLEEHLEDTCTFDEYVTSDLRLAMQKL